ncbi:MAG: GTPase Era [Rickettsiales bacterium]|jgi:GTP-binding protein Era|nr:GTPase Era [Rickettsiales bacterium]
MTGDDIRQKCISVAFAGLANAGKSSLMDKIVGKKISIISPKEQTTRDVIRGIVVEKNTQLIIIDTPGIFIPKSGHPLEKKIVRNAWGGLQEAEAACILIDSVLGITPRVETLIGDILKRQKKIIFTLNKTDLVKKEKLLVLAEQLRTIYPDFLEIFMVSATKGDNVDKLKKYLLSLAKESPWIFAGDEISDAPMKFLASEITREKIFLKLEKELPYSTDVYTEKWEEFRNGDVRIQQVIRVLRESQRAIILGKRGNMLKNINIEARNEMEKFFGRKIHLFIFAQVRGDWIEKG